MTVEPVTTTVAALTPSTSSAACANFDARVWAGVAGFLLGAGVTGFLSFSGVGTCGVGVCGLGVIFAGGAGLGAGFLLVEQPLNANEKLKISVEMIINVFFMAFSLLV